MAKRRPKRGLEMGMARPADPYAGGLFAAKGPSQRQQRVGESLRRALADILIRGDAHDPELARHSIIVTEVRASPDLRHATVFVSALGGREEEAALEALAKNRGLLRKLLSREVTLKYSPELHFERDQSFDQMDETRRLLDQDDVRRDLGSRDGEPDESDLRGSDSPDSDKPD